MTRHRFDAFIACAGVLFLCLAVGFALDGLETWDIDLTWIVPMLLIACGLAGVLSIVARIDREPQSPPEPGEAD